MSYNEEILKASQGIAVAYGNIFVDRDENERSLDHRGKPVKHAKKSDFTGLTAVLFRYLHSKRKLTP